MNDVTQKILSVNDCQEVKAHINVQRYCFGVKLRDNICDLSFLLSIFVCTMPFFRAEQ